MMPKPEQAMLFTYAWKFWRRYGWTMPARIERSFGIGDARYVVHRIAVQFDGRCDQSEVEKFLQNYSLSLKWDDNSASGPVRNVECFMTEISVRRGRILTVQLEGKPFGKLAKTFRCNLAIHGVKLYAR